MARSLDRNEIDVKAPKLGSLAMLFMFAFLVLPGIPSLGQCTVSNLLVNSCGPWLGTRSATYPQVSSNWRNQLLYEELRVGVQNDIVHAYTAPTSANPEVLTLDSDDLYFINRANTYLLLNWKPVRKWVDAGGGNAAINANIDAMADSIKAVAPKKMFLSVWHEPENDISTGITCTTPKGGAGSPADYVNMWHNIRARFDQRGVTNVVWVMIYQSLPIWDCVKKDLWPGDNYIDWLAWDGYPSGSDTWQSKIGGFYNLLYNLEDSTHHFVEKPWMLGEYGFKYTTQPPVYQGYIDAKAAVDHNDFPNLKAYVIFDAQNSRVDYTWGTDGTNGVQDDVEQNYYSDFAKDLVSQTRIVSGAVQLITTASLARESDGSYQATVTVSNNGTGTAQNVSLTNATLGAATGSPLPQSLRSISPGGSEVLMISFPSSAGDSAARVIEQFRGSYAGGTFGGSLRATLP